MSKRQSDEARIIRYVETAPLASVEIVIGIANAKLKERRATDGEGSRGTGQRTTAPAKKRGPNKKKSNATGSGSSAPSTDEMASARTADKASVPGT